MKSKFKPLYDSFGSPSCYVVCPRCGRGIGVYETGTIRHHLRRTRGSGRPCIPCEASGTDFSLRRKRKKKEEK